MKLAQAFFTSVLATKILKIICDISDILWWNSIASIDLLLEIHLQRGFIWTIFSVHVTGSAINLNMASAGSFIASMHTINGSNKIYINPIKNASGHARNNNIRHHKMPHNIPGQYFFLLLSCGAAVPVGCCCFSPLPSVGSIICFCKNIRS